MAGHDVGAMDDTVQQEEGRMAHGERHEMPGMRHPGLDSTGATDSAHVRQMMDLHMRMMADPVIRERIMADTGMHRLMMGMMAEMPSEHREHMRRMMDHKVDTRTRPRKAAPPRLEPESDDSAAHRRHETPD
jgi:hypothetical protein